MKTTELAAEVIASNPDATKQLDELERKVTEVCTEFAKAIGSTFDDVFSEVVRRQQQRAATRGQVRVSVEREALELNETAITTETERRLAELAKKG
jgi:phosphoribosylaminoimidazole-succinocarboxamide synthase